ncbi:MAG: aminoglycoside phosphotransferase family protein [Armatimonadetes bacterium]|nr:aminoglycoside phosphotransferase family protein [Armatimonadota bacterium]
MRIDRQNVPCSVSDLTPEWIQLHIDEEYDFSDFGIERIGEDYGFASEIYRVRLNSVRNIVVKFWNAEKLHSDKELYFYEQFGECISIQIPRCYYAGLDFDKRRAVLVLEAFEGCLQGDVLTGTNIGAWKDIACTLGTFHSQFWDSPNLQFEWINPRIVARDVEWIVSRREKLISLHESKIGRLTSTMLDRLPKMYQESVRFLELLPSTLLHSDLHLDNILFTPVENETVILDWANITRGPGVLDFIAICPQVGNMSNYFDIANSYLEALNSDEMKISSEEFNVQIKHAIVIAFVSNTLGIVNWTPDSEREAKIIDQCFERAELLADLLLDPQHYMD